MLIIIPIVASCADWDDEYLKKRYEGRLLDPIEGVWQFPSDGAKIAIVKSTSTTFDIYLLDSPRLDIKPGAVIGSVVSTPKKRYYDATIESKNLGKKNKLSTETVTMTVNDDGLLSIKPYKDGYSVSFKRWINHIFKVTLIDNTNRRPNDLKGAYRVYPYTLSDHYPICL